jgi:hypothetical protein
VPVAAFSREEDPLRPDYELRRSHDGNDGSATRVPLFVVNNARAVTRFADARIDSAFERVLQETQPGACPCCVARVDNLGQGLADASCWCMSAQAWCTFST